MRSLTSAFPATLACLLFVGCAGSTAPSPDNAAPATELVYRTGSHIPIKDAQPMTKEEREKQAEATRAALERQQRGGTLLNKN
jgi:hypothetical protein